MNIKPSHIFIIISATLFWQKANSVQEFQKETCQDPAITFIDEVSLNNISDKEEGFFDSIFNFIFGEDELAIQKPFNTYVSDNGLIFIVDQGNKSLIVIDKAENEIQNLLPENFKCESPVGLCSIEDGLVFTDSQTDQVWKYDFENEEIAKLNSSLKQPTGIAYIKNNKEIWVCETEEHRIVRLDRTGKQLGIIGQRGLGNSEFNFPTFIWADNRGKVYINDSMNFRIQIFSEEGKFIRSFGKAGDGSGDFSRPKGIATDSFGHIYVVDALFNNVQIFDQEGQLLYVLGNQGIQKGEFWLPAGLYIDNHNRIYVADSFNSRIQIFQLICDGRSKD